ncbi:MAG: hypothetical protein PF482_03765 [Desulfobacteraceae bacterium]|jgi:hypothetical protein|nr:hypothetical protein [Desulfobacteraceae bacterium]
MLIRNSFRFLKIKFHLIKEYYLLFINFLSSIHESLTDHPAVIFLTNRVLSKRIFPRKNPVFNYVNKFISTLIEAALLITATGVLCFIIYYTFGMLWYAYLSTPMADNFISLHPERAETIFEFSELNLIYFSIEVTLSAFIICFAISAVCRFLHICHYLYLSQGLFGKLIYWGVPLTGAVSYYIKNEYGFSDWEATGCMVMLPTYLLFISCFKYSEKLVPEAGDILKILIPWIKRSSRKTYQKINDLAQYLVKP